MQIQTLEKKSSIKSKTKTAVLINLSSGSAQNIKDALIPALKDSGLDNVECFEGTSDEMSKMLKQVENSKSDIIISVGGDGTAKACAQLCVDSDAVFLPLPGGTMNILHKEIYGNDDWQQCLDSALSAPKPKNWPCGMVKDQAFMVGAMFGAPIKFQDVREAVREGEVQDAVAGVGDALQGLRESQKFQIKFESDDKVRVAEFILIRIRDLVGDHDGPKLECLFAEKMDITKYAKLGWDIVRSDWADSTLVEQNLCRNIEILSDEPITAMMDGETADFGKSVDIKLLLDSLKVMAP